MDRRENVVTRGVTGDALAGVRESAEFVLTWFFGEAPCKGIFVIGD